MQTEVNVTNADSKFFLDYEYNLEETISYAKSRGWAETQILEYVRQRLSNAEDINQQIDVGSTPIMSAAAEGYISIVRLLLDAGADLKRKNRWKEDVISCAKLSGNKEIIDLIKNSLNDKDRASSAVSVRTLYFRPKGNIEAECDFKAFC
jgi:ankyrin repeat protein